MRERASGWPDEHLAFDRHEAVTERPHLPLIGRGRVRSPAGRWADELLAAPMDSARGATAHEGPDAT